ncbi:hypothetical protein Pmani_003825 [Petrolisthes manimaculis]|uniref:Uncharacterized protein n=1 Tax=Petrolisthes manimaculis TaxID=1843537 RepID=A0AAE1QHU2_9EUCA|nr:hypothetical protein Pmani_003825 [Petrolisthes manimaculis]
MLCLPALYITLVIITTVLDAGAAQDVMKGDEGEVPWVSPQWWWLSPLLSLPLPPPPPPPPTTTNINTNPDALSLILPLEASRDQQDQLPSSQHQQVNKRGGESCGEVTGRNGVVGEEIRCRRGGGVVPRLTGEEVRHSWSNDYMSVHRAMVHFSQQQQLAGPDVCRDLSVQLFEVDLREHKLEPMWVRETSHLGMCPSMLQERRFGANVWPPAVAEVKCLCLQESCSNLGVDFKCQAVQRPVLTWVRHHHHHNFVPSREMVTVGCVCIRRTSLHARFSMSALQS